MKINFAASVLLHNAGPIYHSPIWHPASGLDRIFSKLGPGIPAPAVPFPESSGQRDKRSQDSVLQAKLLAPTLYAGIPDENLSESRQPGRPGPFDRYRVRKHPECLLLI